jgi:hypothetical protein
MLSFNKEDFKYNGRTIFGDTKGTVALGAALIGLPPHPFDKGKKGYLHPLMMRFVDYPDEVLFTVAEEIHDMVEYGGLRQQLRYDALKQMVEAALAADMALQALIADRC